MISKTKPAEPSLSVVVVIVGGPVSLARCLRRLQAQSRVQGTEIIVPCDERITELSALQKKFPTVSFLSIGGYRTYAELRAIGVGKACGAVVALTEDHCTPAPDWCEKIVQAHGAPFAAVGGAVEKTGSDTAVNWALYLADYGRYMNPKAKGSSSELTDCNVSYKRAALLSIPGVWQPEFHETAVHAALRSRGESLWFFPDIVVRQRRSLDLGPALRDRYCFGRLFGSGRASAVSPFGRLWYAALCLLLPLLLSARVAQHVFRRQRHVGAFFKSIPALLV